MRILALLLSAGLAAPACAAGGKLLLTGGVSSIDGAAGGGLTPWAVTASYATAHEGGATAHLTRARTQDYALDAGGVALAWDDRFEASLARQSFDAGAAVPGATLRLDIAGLKWRVAGDAIVDSDRWMPQLAIGVQFKRLAPGAAVGGVLDAVAAKRRGTDVYASATKLFLAQGLLANLTLRSTTANQNGLLGFGSSAAPRRRIQPELSLAWLLRRDLAVGAEWRAKPDRLSFAGSAFAEDDWRDLFVAWAPNKHVSFTAAWVDLGRIVGRPRQTGAYGSIQLAW